MAGGERWPLGGGLPKACSPVQDSQVPPTAWRAGTGSQPAFPLTARRCHELAEPQACEIGVVTVQFPWEPRRSDAQCWPCAQCIAGGRPAWPALSRLCRALSAVHRAGPGLGEPGPGSLLSANGAALTAPVRAETCSLPLFPSLFPFLASWSKTVCLFACYKKNRLLPRSPGREVTSLCGLPRVRRQMSAGDSVVACPPAVHRCTSL